MSEVTFRVTNLRVPKSARWLVPIFKHVRFVWERVTGFPLDFTLKDTVNDLMFVSAASLSSLYEPLIQLDNTFILQEYFIPPAVFNEWFREFRECIHNRPVCLTLLNITFRFVTRDTESVLSYAPTDSIAVVLYFRIRRDPVLGQLPLIAITNRLGARFYLPYRRYYDAQDILKSYPRIHDFLKTAL